MTNYRETVIKRIRLWRVSISLLTIIIALHYIDVFRPFASSHYFDFLNGTVLGTIVAIMILAITNIRKYSVGLKDERVLRELYNKENDERTQYIQNKSGGMILIACAIIIFIAALIAGFFNIIIFVTLVVVTYFLLFVKLCLKFYYTKKY